MDKHLDTVKAVEEKPIDEMGDLDDQFEDLIFASERAESSRQRFVLAVDATGSMGGVWSMAKGALKAAVDEIKSKTTVPVQIQVIAYRDHECDGERVVDKSNWSDDTEYLYKYIQDMGCFGGGDYPESIGHALAHVKNDQILPNQVILIGDAPSKEGSWGYAEAQFLGQNSCPIYALYTNKEHKLVACFEKLAKLSGGKALYLGNLSSMEDILKVILASNKVLAIEYQPKTLEGKKMLEAMKS